MTEAAWALVSVVSALAFVLGLATLVVVVATR